MLNARMPAPGSWPSSWSAEQAAAAGREINELKVSEQGVFWSEFDPKTAQTLIYCYKHNTKDIAVFTQPGFSVRSRVYEYGGGSFCLTLQGVVFTNESDQQVYLQRWQGAPQRLTQRSQCRYADMQFDALTDSVIAIEEEHSQCGVKHRIVSISLNLASTQACQTPTVIVQGSDFYLHRLG